jgi:hypothetical protein
LVAALFSAAGCARKAPGPNECRAFALSAVGIPSSTTAERLEARRPDLATRADEITRQCLTTPWDYELLHCLERGGDSAVCSHRFRLRRLQGQPELPRLRF